MVTLNVVFDTDVFSAVRKSPAEVADEVRVAAAIVWYAQGVISQGKAAEIAGMSRADFIDALATSNVPACQESAEDLAEELARG